MMEHVDGSYGCIYCNDDSSQQPLRNTKIGIAINRYYQGFMIVNGCLKIIITTVGESVGHAGEFSGHAIKDNRNEAIMNNSNMTKHW